MVRKKDALFIKTFLCLFIYFLSTHVLSNTNFDQRPEIHTYNTSAYSDSSAVVLRREVEVLVEESGLTTRRTYMAILLNNEDAIQDYSQIEINHNSHSSDLTIDFARVYNGDDVNYLKDDAISRQNMSGENYFYDNERTIFSLPNLRKGAVIELQFTKKRKHVTIPGHFDSQFGFYWWEGKTGNSGARLDPVAQSLIRVSYPKSMKLNYRQSSLIPDKPNKTETSSLINLEWVSENLPEIKPENWMPEEINLFPLIYVSSLNGWKDLNRWAHSLFVPHVSEDEKIQAIANEIAKSANSEEDKIRSVFEYMEENIRYVFAHVGRNGYEPHDALDVLNNGYGYCKDQTVLSVSILKALGIDAYPVLAASSGSEMTKGMARNYFDHMFVFIPSSEKRPDMWIDTTGSKLDFPGIHWTNEGKPALVVNGSDNTMRKVISDHNVKHLAEVNLIFESEKGVDVDISMDVIYSGLMGQNVASMLNFAPDKDAFIKEMLSPIYPKANLIKTSYEKIQELKDTYKLSATFVAKDAWKGSPEPLNINLGISQFVGLASNFTSIDEPSKRTQPFQTSLPFEIQLSAKIPHPGGNYAPITINTSPDYESDYFSLKQSGLVSEEGDYLIQASLRSNEMIIPVADYENYYRATRNIIGLPQWFISYQIDETALKLSKISSSAESTDLEEIIANAEVYLNSGEFDDALKLADKAIQIDSENAKAHYLRGVALGYQQMFDESNLAFSKALELGYEL